MTDSPYGITYYVGPNGPAIPSGILSDLAGWTNGGQIPVWLRYQYQWSNVEVTPGTYTWTNLDASVSAINATTGLKLMVPIQGAPPWWRTLDQSGNFFGVTKISSGLTASTQYNSLPVRALPTGCQTWTNGTQLTIDPAGANPETVQINNVNGYNAGATSIKILDMNGNPFVAQFAHSVNSYVVNANAVLPQGSDMATFANALVSRYGNNIAMYQIGNEEWDTYGVGGVRDGAGALLAAVCQAVYPVIKPLTTSPIGMCAVRKVPTLAGQHITNWLTGFYNAGGKGYTDFVDFHYYRGGTSAGNDPNTSDANTPSVGQEISILQGVISNFRDGIPVYCLETGWDITGTGAVTAAQQSQYLLEMFDAHRLNNPHGRCFVYTMNNGGGGDSKSVTQGTSPEVYEQAYTDIANYIKSYPTWLISSGLAMPPIVGRDGAGQLWKARTGSGNAFKTRG